jgi:hypothetical protein
MSRNGGTTQRVKPPETNIEVLLRLLRKGGHIIVAGGETKDLPARYREHPQVIVWDDNDQDFAHKKVPTNTRGIVYNRWISHSNAQRLRLAANQLSIPVFPLLRKREVLEVLDTITNIEVTADVPDAPMVEAPRVTAPVEEISLPDVPEDTSPAILMNEDIMRKVRRGEMSGEILPKEDTNPNETPGQAAKRLHPIIKKKYNIQILETALAQAIRVYRIRVSATPSRTKDASKKTTVAKGKIKDKETIKVKVDDFADFAEGEKLLRDARAAIDLFLDYLPKLRKRQAELTSRQEKIRELLGES